MELVESICLTSGSTIKPQSLRQYATGTKAETYQWNKIEINSHAYGHFIFDKEGKNIQWRKDNLFNKWCWENWSPLVKEIVFTPLYILAFFVKDKVSICLWIYLWAFGYFLDRKHKKGV